MPASPFIYGILRRWFGASRNVYQVFNTLLFCLTIVLTRSIGTRLWNRQTGLYAAFLLLGSPFLLILVPQHLSDVHVMFFLVLYFYSLLRLGERDGRIWPGIVALSGIIFLFSKFTAWPMLICLTCLMFVFAPTLGLSRLKLTLSSGLIVLTSCLFMWLKADVFKEQFHLLTSFQNQGLSSWKEAYVSTFFFQYHLFVPILALAGCYLAVKQREVKMILLAWFPVLVLALSMERSRYLLPFFPFLTLMAGYGLQIFREKLARQYTVMVVVLFSLILVHGAYLPFTQSSSMMNLKEAGEYINNLPGESVTVLAHDQTKSRGSTLAAIPLLSLYTDKKILLPADYVAENLTSPASYTHSLQFTHNMPLGKYYQKEDATSENLFIVIDDGTWLLQKDGSLGQLQQLKRFEQTSGVFKYQTVLTVLKR